MHVFSSWPRWFKELHQAFDPWFVLYLAVQFQPESDHASLCSMWRQGFLKRTRNIHCAMFPSSGKRDIVRASSVKLEMPSKESRIIIKNK